MPWDKTTDSSSIMKANRSVWVILKTILIILAPCLHHLKELENTTSRG